MKCIWKNVILIGFALVLCVMATGCMGGQKDIKKDEEAAYTEMIAAAAEEFGYEYEQQKVIPKGSALVYVLFNGDEELDIRIRIDEESTYDKVACQFELTRNIDEPAENTAGLEQHIPVLVRIAEHFTDEITVAEVSGYLTDDSLWKEGKSDEEPFMYKDMEGNLQHIIEEDGDEFEEYFFFGWDNGQKYKLRKDK